ncbi:MAG: glycosyltransferase family 4 protein [Candidatus Bilamarchaeaceae archaeon]
MLFISCGFTGKPSGIGRILSYIIKAISDYFDVYVLADFSINKDLEELFQKNGAKTLSGKTRGYSLKGLYEIFKVVKKVNPSCVVSNDRCSTIKTFLLSRFLNFKHVGIVHGVISLNRLYSRKFSRANYFLDGFMYGLYCKALKEAHKDIAVSMVVKKDLIYSCKLPSEKIEVIYNYVDTELFKPLSYNPAEIRGKLGLPTIPFTLLFCGRLELEKNPEFLIKVVLELSRKGYDVQGIFIGDGTLRNELETEVKKLRLEDKVFFIGLTKDLTGFYNACDLLLHPCSIESFGLVVAEAMACGRPVIGFNGGNLPYLIKDGETGFLVKPNDLNQTCEKIELYIRDKQMWYNHAKASRDFIVQNFSWMGFSNQYIDFFKTIAGKEVKSAVKV